MAAFDTCLARLLKDEGGFVNNKRDNGGMTNLGVTWRTWQDYTGKPATETVMRGLTIAKVAPLYRDRYWTPVHCDELPLPLAMCVFDFAVNAGPGRAVKWLQKLVGASVDGQFGPATQAAIASFMTREGIAASVRGFQNLRRAYYHSLDDFDVFGRGWLNRVNDVETAALRLIL